MKKLIQPGNYTFVAAAKTVSLDEYISIDQENILLITNVTDGIIIYNFADPSKGGIVAGNTVTLDFDTTTMSDTDILQIHYWDNTYINGVTIAAPTSSGSTVTVNATEENELIVAIGQMNLLLKRTLQSIEYLPMAQLGGKIRVDLSESGTLPFITTVSTVSSVSNINTLGNIGYSYTDSVRIPFGLDHLVFNNLVNNTLSY